jgi:hypothetical protein
MTDVQGSNMHDIAMWANNTSTDNTSILTTSENLYDLCQSVTSERAHWAEQTKQWKEHTVRETLARNEAANKVKELVGKEQMYRDRYERLLITCKSQRGLISQLQRSLLTAKEETVQSAHALQLKQEEYDIIKLEVEHLRKVVRASSQVLEARRDVLPPMSEHKLREIEFGDPNAPHETSHAELQRVQMSLTQHLSTPLSPPAPKPRQSLYLTRAATAGYNASFEGGSNAFPSPSRGGASFSGTQQLSPKTEATSHTQTARELSTAAMPKSGNLSAAPVLIVQRGGRSVRVKVIHAHTHLHLYT